MKLKRLLRFRAGTVLCTDPYVQYDPDLVPLGAQGLEDPQRRVGGGVVLHVDGDGRTDLRRLGVPLEYVPEDEFGRSGYLVQKDLYFLDQIRFTMEEGIVLAVGTGRLGDDGELKPLAVKEGDRIARIVEGLLSFARRRREDKTVISIEQILSDSMALTAAQLRNDNITVKTDLPEDLPNITAQAHEIEQVFVNIISNACHALNEKFSDPRDHDDKILEIVAETTTFHDQPYVRVSFKDNGTGIPAAVIDKVMNPFFSTKTEGKRTGLGLSISHGIVEEHGGSWVESRMSRLAGEFAGILRVSVPSANVDALSSGLEGLRTGGLRVVVERGVEESPDEGTVVLLELVGGDRPGIVHGRRVRRQVQRHAHRRNAVGEQLDEAADHPGEVAGVGHLVVADPVRALDLMTPARLSATG